MEAKPFKEGMWISKSNGEYRLVGSKCKHCNELYFPKKYTNICVHCQENKLEEIELGPYGTIHSFSAAMQPPAGGFYAGKVPYCYGLVDLDEGVRVQTHLEGNYDKLEIDMKVQLVIKKLCVDSEGNELEFFSFEPIGV